MFKETKVNDVWSKVMATMPDKKMQYLEKLSVEEFNSEDINKIKYFNKSVNMTKKGDKAYLMLGNNIYRLAKKNGATAITNYIREIKINNDRSMFYIGMIF